MEKINSTNYVLYHTIISATFSFQLRRKNKNKIFYCKFAFVKLDDDAFFTKNDKTSHANKSEKVNSRFDI